MTNGTSKHKENHRFSFYLSCYLSVFHTGPEKTPFTFFMFLVIASKAVSRKPPLRRFPATFHPRVPYAPRLEIQYFTEEWRGKLARRVSLMAIRHGCLLAMPLEGWSKIYEALCKEFRD